MCGRFSLTTSPAAISKHFGFDVNFPIEPRYNIAPSQNILTINAKHEPVLLRWGLIPSWAKDPSIGNKMINARSETVAEKPSFRSAYRSRRCLIPADGFYEWKREGSVKQPYHIRRDDHSLFCFAGLWEGWSGPDAPISSCTIITTDANSLIKPIHHRMPVVVQYNDYGAWLTGDHAETDELMLPYKWVGFETFPVSTYVNNARNQGQECLSELQD